MCFNESTWEMPGQAGHDVEEDKMGGRLHGSRRAIRGAPAIVYMVTRHRSPSIRRGAATGSHFPGAGGAPGKWLPLPPGLGITKIPRYVAQVSLVVGAGFILPKEQGPLPTDWGWNGHSYLPYILIILATSPLISCSLGGSGTRMIFTYRGVIPL